MVGRRSPALAIAAVVSLAAMACSPPPIGTDDSCADQVRKDKVQVRTNHRWTNDDLPGVGDYFKIHWQVRAIGDPCSRVPGPTDLRYQGLIEMRPEDTESLVASYNWLPVSALGEHTYDTPAQIWPDMARLGPADARWLYARDYAEAHLQNRYWGALYIDADHHVAFFVLNTH